MESLSPSTYPLGEVFGYPTGNFSAEAERHRQLRLCPFNNRVGPSCTKNSVTDPLGVCTLAVDGYLTPICPVRFNEGNVAIADAARFLFGPSATPRVVQEVPIRDQQGATVGRFDYVLVTVDSVTGEITDFGVLEVQSVYISGNITDPFRRYLQDPTNEAEMDWRGQPKYPRPDYLSSSRKRLLPQLLTKGTILNAWRKKLTVALHQSFFATLPPLPEVDLAEAEVAWLIYDLRANASGDRFNLTPVRQVYTRFQAALDAIAIPSPGPVEQFIATLHRKLATGEPHDRALPDDQPVSPRVLFSQTNGEDDDDA